MNAHEDILEKVKVYTDQAHGVQTRKYTDDRYIVHPLRVMGTVRKYNEDIAVLSAALLHDVLEDTPVTKKELGEFLESVMDKSDAARTLKLVVELTDVYTKQDYPSVNRKKRKIKEAERLGAVSGSAQTIKYADIIDNTDVTNQDRDFAKTYLREAKHLLEKMQDGDPQLRKRAIQLVEECLAIVMQDVYNDAP